MIFQNSDRFRKLGDLARDRKDWKAAARAYERYLKRNSWDAAIWIQLGHACKESCRFSAAQIAYQRALFLRPHDADIYVQCGHLHAKLGEVHMAIGAYRRALELDPALSSARNALADYGHEPVAIDPDVVDRLAQEVKRLKGRLGLIEQMLQEGRFNAEGAGALRGARDAIQKL